MQRPTLVLIGAVVAIGAGVAWQQLGKRGRAPAELRPVATASARPAASAEPLAATTAALPAAPSSASVPPLPPDAPKKVSFGVVLLTHRSAEAAPKDARSKSDALEKAKALLGEAQKDFSEAVKKGDRGSTTDAGQIPRGVLEPEIEYAVFTLEKGQVYGAPLDTPRGYWLVRRNP